MWVDLGTEMLVVVEPTGNLSSRDLRWHDVQCPPFLLTCLRPSTWIPTRSRRRGSDWRLSWSGVSTSQ